jgi:maltokinase
VSSQLSDLVAEWLPRQRWFGGKGRTFTVVLRELTAITADEPTVAIWLADTTFDNGEVSTYQLPLVLRADAEAGLDHVLVGTIETDRGPRLVYDALHDKDVTQAWLLGIREEIKTGPVTFERFTDPERVPLGSASIVLTGEQSNTSLIYGDQAIMKVFRRLEHGVNPDIEIHAALGALDNVEHHGNHIAPILGAVTADIDGETVSLAMLQEFMTTATDGWDLARASVRDLMAEADLHAEEAGGDFAGEAERLGAATAQVHADLARTFGTSQLTADERGARAAAMHTRLDAALTIVPALSFFETGLRSVFDDFARSAVVLLTQRVHGDLHLGQTLRTVHRWIILDFEGEPSSSIEERRRFDSPLRDVAGMLRSIDYAARFQLVGTSSPQLEYRAREWAERNRDAFLAGYADVSGLDPVGDRLALRGFEADKAVYEAVYEARNRPDWLPIPLASLARLAGAEEGL